MTRKNEKLARTTEEWKGMVMLGKWRDFHGELWGENLVRNALSLENFEARIIMGKYKVWWECCGMGTIRKVALWRIFRFAWWQIVSRDKADYSLPAWKGRIWIACKIPQKTNITTLRRPDHRSTQGRFLFSYFDLKSTEFQHPPFPIISLSNPNTPPLYFSQK